MNTRIVSLCSALALAVALVGCVDLGQPDDSSVSTTAKIASNAMLPTVIQPTGIYSAPLTGVSIANSGLEATAGGRSYLGYMLECALRSGTSITSNYQLNQYTYAGAIGIAPAWTTRALTLPELRYISSCVLARSNVFGQPVIISMRGDAPGLATTTDEATNYNTEEGAFYGNIFDTHPNQIHACNGVDQVRDGDTFGDLPLRQCAQPDPNNPGKTLCNFVFDGNCADICVRNGDHYSSCGPQTEVITIRLLGTAP